LRALLLQAARPVELGLTTGTTATEGVVVSFVATGLMRSIPCPGSLRYSCLSTVATAPPRKLRRDVAVLLSLMPSLTVTVMTRSVEFGKGRLSTYSSEAITSWYWARVAVPVRTKPPLPSGVTPMP
jgi:hypothetical protein